MYLLIAHFVQNIELSTVTTGNGDEVGDKGNGTRGFTSQVG